MITNPNFDINRWNHDVVVFRNLFKNTLICLEKDGYSFQGDLSIETEVGREVGPFTLKIIFNDNYYLGKKPPSTYLMSHRNVWKAIGDAHIEMDWKLCLFLTFESHIDFNEYDSFQKYLSTLSNFMVDLWLYQEEIKNHGFNKAKWRGPQRSHNFKGFLEGMLANLKDEKSLCPCGSSIVFRECCKKIIDNHAYQEFQSVR